MRLKRIEFKNFRRLVDFQAQFRPGINVVKGPLNEMGKSTLLEGISAALFYNPKSTAKRLKDYASWGSTKQCRISLEFENREIRYLLEKDFDKGTIRLIGENGREELDTFKEISEKMAELLGTNSDRLFSCTSCIRQAEVRAISSGEKEISESLEEVVTGGKESTLASEIIQKLDDKISEMKRGLDRPAKIPGVLASLKNKLQDTSRKYDEVKDEVSKAEARKIELVEVNKQLAQVKEQYENAKALLEKNKRRKDIEASIERLTKDYNDVEELVSKIKNQEKDSKEADEALRDIGGFEDKQQVLELRKELDAVQNRCWNIENDLAMREGDLAEAKRELDRKKYARFLGSGKSIGVAIILLAGGIIGALLEHLYLLSLLILGVAFIVIAMWARATIIRDKTTISSIEDRIQRMKRVLGELREEEREMLAKAKCNTDAEFNEKERDFYYWLEKKERAAYLLEGVLNGKTIQDIEKRRLGVARNLAVEQANLTDDLTATRLSPEEYIELEKKVRGLEEKQAEFEKRKRYSEAVINLAEEKEIDADRQIKLEEEVENLQEALSQEEKRVKIYELAREFISQARAETFLSANEVLEKEIQNYFSVFTNGKYKQVKINKEGLEFRVYSDEKGDWARPDELSGGAIDEFYLAFRLALVKLIFRDKKPPLLLDDPFVNFDSVRLSNTLNFFKTLAGDYQIIIFTLSDLYDKVADNIISLGDKGMLL